MTTTVNQLLNSRANRDEIFSVTPDTLVIDAIKTLTDKKVGALLVLDNNKLAGIFSERDYTRKVILNARSSSETKVSEIMTAATDVKSVDPSQTVDECMVIMSKHHIRHLPVIKDDEPVGILSIMDVVRNIISEKEFIIEQLEHYITDTA
ncbi:MAG: CBS domain-containing protein [Proteobacteria bacterium]|nr:CBS domain-containing protein [Pseudomonadota bacterium]NOG61369.1 CBS domain-containing protein [Pseudomonadota bacterium]